MLVEPGAGEAAGYTDSEYNARGAKFDARDAILSQAAVIAQVRTVGANPDAGRADLDRLRRGQILIGLGEPLTARSETADLASRGVTLFALELVPRITRAQGMDVLSSMASLAGYKAVLMAANALPKMLPMMTTAAGTISPARVLVLGAGVAGLQAIATARRLGAVVSGYDIRPAAREQVESLGAKFVVLEGVDAAGSEDKGGYAKAMGDEFYRRQQAALAAVISEMDIVVATAAVPGKKAPVLVTTEAVDGMAPGSVVLDLAAERGGNCAVTRPGETVERRGVQVMGPLNVPSMVPFHASQMFATNIAAFLKLLINKTGELAIPWNDEIVRETAVLKDGEVVNSRVAELLGMPAQMA